MLILLAPSKTMNGGSARGNPHSGAGNPEHLNHAAVLAEEIHRAGSDALARRLKIRGTVLARTVQQYSEWSVEGHTEQPSAIHAFQGTVFTAFDAPSLDEEGLQETRRRVRILSTLYGILRPQDAVMPHRLEVDGAVATHWKHRVTETIIRDVLQNKYDTVVNLASREFIRLVDIAAVERAGIRMITPIFLDTPPQGVPRIVAVHAKRQRGAMARWMVDNRITDAAALRRCTTGGYQWDGRPGRDGHHGEPRDHSGEEIVFIR